MILKGNSMLFTIESPSSSIIKGKYRKMSSQVKSELSTTYDSPYDDLERIISQDLLKQTNIIRSKSVMHASKLAILLRLRNNEHQNTRVHQLRSGTIRKQCFLEGARNNIPKAFNKTRVEPYNNLEKFVNNKTSELLNKLACNQKRLDLESSQKNRVRK